MYLNQINCTFFIYTVLAFIKSDRPNKYPNLTIRYVRGLDPLIKLMDSNGNVQEVRNILLIFKSNHVIKLWKQ